MTGHVAPRRIPETGHVRLVTVPQALEEARSKLEDYERRYGVASERLREAFTDATGKVRETGEYLQWSAMLERWRELSAQATGLEVRPPR